MDERANPGLQAIAGAAALIVALVGLFVLTGVVGRVQRNEATLFVVGLCAAVLAATFLVIGDRLVGGADPTPRAQRAARWVSILAYALGMAGIVLAVVASVKSASTSERPVVTGSFSTDDPPQFTATVKADNLASSRRVVVIVDGLTPEGATWRPHTVYQAYIGPDKGGSVNQSVTLRIPGLRDYEAVGVKAYTHAMGVAPNTSGATASDDTPCSTYPRQVSNESQAVRVLENGPGCVILETPPARMPTASATPAAP